MKEKRGIWKEEKVQRQATKPRVIETVKKIKMNLMQYEHETHYFIQFTYMTKHGGNGSVENTSQVIFQLYQVWNKITSRLAIIKSTLFSKSWLC